MHNRTSGPYLKAINRILIALHLVLCVDARDSHPDPSAVGGPNPGPEGGLFFLACMQDAVYEEFAEAVTSLVRKVRLGGGMEAATTLGPLISQAAVERVR
jgi:Aldehyde dehydrogenase family